MEILDASTGETIALLNVENRIDPDQKWRTERAVFSPDGKYLATTGIAACDKGLIKIQEPNVFYAEWPSQIGKVFLWDTQTFQLLQEWNFEGDEYGVDFVSVAFSSDAKQVLVGHSKRRDLSKNEVLLTLIVAQFDADSGQLLKSREITQRGALPLIPEFRVLCNSQTQALTIHHWPERITLEDDTSFRGKMQSFFDIRRWLPFP
jgi:WD40 repeat protein